jgi:hypothetical protein
MAGTIQTGATSSIKAGALNGAVEQEKVEAANKQAADDLAPQSGDVLYTKPGEPTFNTMYGTKRISFIGGKFMVRKADIDAEAIVEALDYFVAQGILTKLLGPSSE